jgi:Probable zinc-ribbon domain
MNAMKSAKQRRGVTKAQRNRRKAEGSRAAKKQEQTLRPFLTVPVNEELLAPNNSYGAPDFVTRGFYVDRPFRCKDCGKDQVWTATQQKWWYEVVKGFAWSTAIRCRACRRKERERQANARQVHLEGTARKRARLL